VLQGLDQSLHTLQGLLLEPIGPLSQLLEAVNDPNPPVLMDQIGDSMTITLLANASINLSLMRRTKVLEEYNKEFVAFAAEKREIGQWQFHVCLAQIS